ncbi:MAG TPA: SpoIID/LytB domain-containing protein, partial [Elusimicrobiales bacterium]|nr:SpoIID/LytB domain-containing protein [Elusimicrobiales bacterium]
EELELEKYLYGVLPLEMGPRWPMEALKAQAVIARTYALFNKNKYYKQGFDLSNDVKSQAYGANNADHPRVMEAVNSTKGEVLTYKGKLLDAVYHANCGGRTSPPIWGGKAIEPLSGVKCPYCKNTPNYNWSKEISKEKLLVFCNSRGYKVKKIKNIKSDYKNRAGRVLKLQFITDIGKFIINTGALRNWIGGNIFKSHYVTQIIPGKDEIKFVGKGYGHGVGMCQNGAMVMAKNKKNYKKILRYYYPGAKIGRLRYN